MHVYSISSNCACFITWFSFSIIFCNIIIVLRVFKLQGCFKFHTLRNHQILIIYVYYNLSSHNDICNEDNVNCLLIESMMFQI
jgi:hypothetical protein